MAQRVERCEPPFSVRVRKVEDTALNDSIEPFSCLDFMYVKISTLCSFWQHARLDQWLDRFLYTEKVTGSNPVSSIFFLPSFAFTGLLLAMGYL